MSTLWFSVPFPTDGEGFVGRACRAPSCRRYFKVQASGVPQKLYCPYCGTSGAVNQTHTPEQTGYAREVLEEKARKYAHDEVQKMFRNAVGGLPRSGPVSFKFTPGPAYVERPVPPRYREKTVDTDLACPECHFRFRVYGIFGYCPKCRTENAQIYDTNLAIIRKELAEAVDAKRALRHAYSDLVSTVEIFCRSKVDPLAGQKRPSFQRLTDVEELAVARSGEKLDELLALAELAALRSVFQKRHVNVHNSGVVDERFAREIPGSAHLIGQPVEMSLEEFEAGAQAVHKLIAALFLPPGVSGLRHLA